MPFFNLQDGTELFYEDHGQGTPVLFLHGVWMSGRFFKRQLPYFQEKHRAITLDFRGHGNSDHVHFGHTVATYAKDLHEFIEGLNLKNVILVGWSMGAFVLWDYINQFGTGNIKGTVVVDELASDFKWPDFPLGAFDFPALTHIMKEIQTNRTGFLLEFIPLMFKDVPSEADFAWMLEETTKLPESIASAILFDQSVVDYRSTLANVTAPTLLCFGRDEKLIPVAAGEHLQENIKDSRLLVFENSCHCPFLEEPERFNAEVDAFIASLK